MLKVSTFLAESDFGLAAVPLFGPADRAFEKTATRGLLSEVVKYIEGLRPRNDAQYVLVNAMGASEYFGCFPAGTLVDTVAGPLAIEAVPEGLLVVTHQNRLCRVVARQEKQATELCDLTVQGLPSEHPALTATPNHEMWVVTRDDFVRTKRKIVWKGDTSESLAKRRERALQEMEFSWIPIAELRAGDMVSEPFPLEEKEVLPEEFRSSGAAFLLGLYAAEGSIVYRYDRDQREHAGVVYVISEEEEDKAWHIAEIADGLGHKAVISKDEARHALRVQLSWKTLAQVCHDQIGSGALNKKLGWGILLMPRGWQETFFDAYAGGDGCVRRSGKEEGAVRCTSASARLLRDFRLLLARLGVVASISGRHNTKATWYSGRPIYELLVSAGQMNGRSTSKSYIHPGGYILSAVKETRVYAWSGPVYDLQVEGDASYTASGFAVHNSNINGDHFPEEALIHKPDGWQGVPVFDRALAKDWPYGFPTFYGASPYAHHKNKDPGRAFGEVELAAWNDHMKRVELVVRVDKDKCARFGGTAVWDKLKDGQYADVSMGSKVPWDLCAICANWDAYRTALQMFDPKKHKHPGMAVLEYHKTLKAKDGVGIRGLSVTRSDYCEHTSKSMNRILPDGRKIFVYNFFPRFFDISFVFIGADRTAKVMIFIVRAGQTLSAPSTEVASSLGVRDPDEKVASIDEHLFEQLFGKSAEEKAGTIHKEVKSNLPPGKAIPLLTEQEKDFPPEALQALRAVPSNNALSTTAGLGMLLKPHEFARVMEGREDATPALSADSFMPALARLLLPLMESRSALGPILERRVILMSARPAKEGGEPSSLSSSPLRKMGATYDAYRRGVMDVVTNTQSLLERAAGPADCELHKLAEAPAEELFTPLTYEYLDRGFMDDALFGDTSQAVVENSSQAAAGVQRGIPSRNTW